MTKSKRRDAGRLRATASCITPGVWSTAVPFPSFLGYSFSYSIWVPSGVVVIDLGWDSDEAWEAFRLGLSRANASLDDIVGVAMTHTHPDHFGLAARLKAESGAWIAGHRDERRNLLLTPESRDDRVDDLVSWLELCGAPTNMVLDLSADAVALTDALPQVDLDVTLEDGDIVPETDGALRVIHTPGHTAGHLCFRDDRRQLLFTGDHILPRVTPNVSKRPGSLDDPMLDYAHSNEVLSTHADDLVLPGHEWPFEDAPARSAQIRKFDRERRMEIESLVRQGCPTVWAVAESLSWSRPFGTLNVRGKRQALGETHAHVHRLVAEGALTSIYDGGTLHLK